MARISMGRSFHRMWLLQKKLLAKVLLQVAFDAFVEGIIEDTNESLSSLENLNLDWPEKNDRYDGSDKGE